MREPEPHLFTFPMAGCENCGKDVLTYVFLGGAGERQRACVHCDHIVTGGLRWVSADELAADGYQIDPLRRSGSCGGSCTCSTRTSSSFQSETTAGHNPETRLGGTKL
jgi:hypothetical protein